MPPEAAHAPTAITTRGSGMASTVRVDMHLHTARSFDCLSAPDAVIELLAIKFDPKEEGAGTVTLVLAGGGAIKLDVECIDAEMSDLTAPWKARGGKPAHES